MHGTGLDAYGLCICGPLAYSTTILSRVATAGPYFLNQNSSGLSSLARQAASLWTAFGAQ